MSLRHVPDSARSEAIRRLAVRLIENHREATVVTQARLICWAHVASILIPGRLAAKAGTASSQAPSHCLRRGTRARRGSLAACGGGSGAASSSDTSTSTTAASTGSAGAGTRGPNSAAFAKYAACLKKNGVDLPAGGPGAPPGPGNGPPSTDGSGNGAPPPAPGGDSSKFQKAQTACASLRPARASGGFRGAGGPNSAATAAFATA